jgi:anthranilate/para-aminobenzoate synthase component I
LSSAAQTTLAPQAVCERLRTSHPVSLLLDGGGTADGWRAGPLVAVEPLVLHTVPAHGSSAAVRTALADVGRTWRERREHGGGSGTGLALVLAYDALDADAAPERDLLGTPRLVALEVDRSVRWAGRERVERLGAWDDATGRRTTELLAAEPTSGDAPAARAIGRPRTSLPHEAYVDAIGRLGQHIVDGDIYQANLCRVWHGPYGGDVLRAYDALAQRTPAPRSAFLETPDLALASASPEVFLTLDPPDRIETWPIKGTRPRGATAEADRAAQDDLRRSDKDQAELLMIVDLERNDLGRVCRTGTIEASAHELRSFATVHHLMARVHGRLRDDVGLDDLVAATFPGGSISGAPKERARSILQTLEPVRRDFFTGSLFWLGDDGSLDSSILIRTLVFRGGQFHLGAGGGVVFDSTADQEWDEANHKARALAGVLGFEPEDAG